jgi:uncharacterized Tic20 family protein
LRDVSIRANPYPALAIGSTAERGTNKEVVLMRHENRNPTNWRLHAALYTMLALALGFAGLVAIVGPGRAIDLLVTYLIPVVAILGVVLWLYFLLRRVGGGRDYYDGKSYEKWYDRF